MKVSECRSCPYHTERRWTTVYKPAHFHAIGVTHVYAYCKKYDKRCLEVGTSKCRQKNNE